MRRNNLSYLRERSGKSARLSGRDFDRTAVNDVAVEEEPVEVKEEAKEEPKKEEAKAEAKEEAKEEPAEA